MVHTYCISESETIKRQIGHGLSAVPLGLMSEIDQLDRDRSFSAPLATLKAATSVTIEDLKRAHDEVSIDLLLARGPNGSAQYSASSISSALLNCRSARRTALALTCGYQTEGHTTSGRPGVVNGPAVAALKYLQVNPGHRLGILVCDLDGAAGTLDILSRLPDARARILVRIAPTLLPGHAGAEKFFDWLRYAIHELNDFRCDSLLYQAGLNMHRSYREGGSLTTSQIVQRDALVFDSIQAGIAWHFGEIRESDYADGGESPAHICLLSIEATVRAKVGLDRHYAERRGIR